MPQLGAGEIHVWRIRVSEALPVVHGNVAAEEWKRAMRYRRLHDAQRFIATRAAVRCILSSYLEVEPRRLQLKGSVHEKPSVVGLSGTDTIRFSITHADDLALIAVSARNTVGIDAEKLKPLEDLERVARYFCTPAQLEVLRSMPAQRREWFFYTLWTRREALFKASGLLGADVPAARACSSHVFPSLSVPATVASIGKWLLASFEAAPGYIVTAATAATPTDISVSDFGSSSNAFLTPIKSMLRPNPQRVACE